MKIFIFSLTLLFLLNPIYCDLKFVIELFRHGARGPLGQYYDYWNQTYMSGELTSVGIRQHYDLGQKLRQEYIEQLKFIDPQYNHSQVYYRSTDLNRTIMSALSHLYGFFPISTGPNLPKGIQPQLTLPPYTGVEYKDIGQAGAPLNFQPMPVHSVNDSMDELLNPWLTCRNLDNINNQFFNSQSNLTTWFDQQFSQTYTLLAKMLNVPQVFRENVSQIYDVFICDIYENRKIPPMSPELWNNITFITDFNWYFSYGSLIEQRLMNTHIFQSIIAYMDPVVNNKSNNGLKWVGWSAHDSNIAQVNTGLNFSSYQCNLDLFFNGSTNATNCLPRPFFASQLMFELHQQNNQYYVMIKYDGEYLKICESNNTQCAYNEFKQRLLNFAYSQNEYDSICQNQLSDYTINANQSIIHNHEYYIIIIGIQVVLLSILGIWAYLIRKRKYNKKLIIENNLSSEETKFNSLQVDF